MIFHSTHHEACALYSVVQQVAKLFESISLHEVKNIDVSVSFKYILLSDHIEVDPKRESIHLFQALKESIRKL